uniref:Uncharacterized protein n=1 Tax=Globisporangium ultimum (strain ATCC 200006 / CBS 805.95 / DAOM BR144) TaxID=431595 RepID=K3WC88_GLOUD
MQPQNTTNAMGIDSRSFCTIRFHRVSLSRASLIALSSNWSCCVRKLCKGYPLAIGSLLSSGVRVPALNDLRPWIIVVVRNLT